MPGPTHIAQYTLQRKDSESNSEEHESEDVADSRGIQELDIVDALL